MDGSSTMNQNLAEAAVESVNPVTLSPEEARASLKEMMTWCPEPEITDQELADTIAATEGVVGIGGTMDLRYQLAPRGDIEAIPQAQRPLFVAALAAMRGEVERAAQPQHRPWLALTDRERD